MAVPLPGHKAIMLSYSEKRSERTANVSQNLLALLLVIVTLAGTLTAAPRYYRSSVDWLCLSR
jgi:hypothetical protein